MELEFFGAAKEVTGSCHSVTTENEKILVDCGMFQGGKDMERMNYDNFNFDPKEYDAMVLTHAHLDHCGRIPKLIKFGFKGKIFCTDATKELTQIILLDSAKIAREDTDHENKRRAEQGLPPRKPLYNEVDVNNAMKLFVDVEYGENVKISKNVTARFYDAGHILGSASVQLEITEGKKKTVIVFSGDMGQPDAVLVKNATPITQADYILMESTYGDRLHPPLNERRKELLRIINETYKRGGKLLIPSFAIERAQEIVYYIGEFMQQDLIPKMNVYLDSPMAMRATDVFSKFKDYLNEDVQQSIKMKKDPFNFPGLIRTLSVEESKKINNVKEPCIIIAGNGMCTAGRIKHHIRNNIEDPKNTLLLVGYQVRGTLGYWLEHKEKIIRLLGVQIKVNSKIESIDGFSAHADYNELISWLNNFSPKPKKIFIVHGDDSQSLAFSTRINKMKFTSIVPSIGDKIKL